MEVTKQAYGSEFRKMKHRFSRSSTLPHFHQKHYYLRSRRIAMRRDNTLQYIHQDHITSSTVMTPDNDNRVGAIKYYPYVIG